MIIKNIWAVGRNYAEHAKELGNAVPTSPMIFLKAGTCVTLNKNVQIPTWCEDVHHELEIALRWNESLSMTEMTLALDLTERKLQAELKKQGHPWTLAKSFTNSCPLCTKWIPYESNQVYFIELYKNKILAQKGSTSEMIHSIEKLKKFVEEHFPVHTNDILLTGTPAGVGPLKADDHLEAFLINVQGEKLISQEWFF